ncbi:hypothetical protein BDV59DRAFT_24295 [Aspergillus ambiguus]|uniref:uncharacterized protein n=1 Tax=Aspergillus ambiguus TaxID=176160 RepID=UPI003CCE2C68
MPRGWWAETVFWASPPGEPMVVVEIRQSPREALAAKYISSPPLPGGSQSCFRLRGRYRVRRSW